MALVGVRPLGQILITRGVVSADDIEDLLAAQSQRQRLASSCLAHQLASEKALAAALSEQTGWPAVVLEESIIETSVLEGLDLAWARAVRALPVAQDRRRLILAVADPDGATALATELERRRGLPVELHIAVELALARAIRAVFGAFERGERQWQGPGASRDRRSGSARLTVVAPSEAPGEDVAQAERELIAHATMEVRFDDGLAIDQPAEFPGTGEWHGAFNTTSVAEPPPQLADGTGEVATNEVTLPTNELDLAPPETARPADDPHRVLVVEPDADTVAFITAALEAVGAEVVHAPSLVEAMTLLCVHHVDVVITMAGDKLDGFRLARTLKRSAGRAQLPVLLLAAPAGPPSVDLMTAYGVDAVLEQPLDAHTVAGMVHEALVRAGRVGNEPAFAQAMRHYQAGELDAAITRLREGIEAEPGNLKARFVLGNLLQKQQAFTAAISEYEAVLAAEPSYFPALTRVAYLYYRQGQVGRAIDTWQRALPVCDDEALRRNIELFLDKLQAELGAYTAVPI